MKRLAGTVFLIICCIAFGAFLARDALHNNTSQKVKTSQDRQKMDKVELDRTTLLRQQVNLESNAGREAKARSLGYKKPDENQIPLYPTGNQ